MDKWRTLSRRAVPSLLVTALVIWMIAAPRTAFQTSLSVVRLWWELIIPVLFPTLVAGWFFYLSDLSRSILRFVPGGWWVAQALAVGTVGCGLFIRQSAQRYGWTEAQFQSALRYLYIQNPLWFVLLCQAQPYPMAFADTFLLMTSYYLAVVSMLVFRAGKNERLRFLESAPQTVGAADTFGEQLSAAVRHAAELSLWYGCACLAVQILFAAWEPLQMLLDPFVAKQQVHGYLLLIACTWGGFSSHLMLFLQMAGKKWSYRRFVSVRLQQVLLSVLFYGSLSQFASILV